LRNIEQNAAFAGAVAVTEHSCHAELRTTGSPADDAVEAATLPADVHQKIVALTVVAVPAGCKALATNVYCSPAVTGIVPLVFDPHNCARPPVFDVTILTLRVPWSA